MRRIVLIFTALVVVPALGTGCVGTRNLWGYTVEQVRSDRPVVMGGNVSDGLAHLSVYYPGDDYHHFVADLSGRKTVRVAGRRAAPAVLLRDGPAVRCDDEPTFETIAVGRSVLVAVGKKRWVFVPSQAPSAGERIGWLAVGVFGTPFTIVADVILAPIQLNWLLGRGR